jgi:hypothetical protein
MAIALVTGQNASAQSTAPATTIAVSFPAAVGAGNLIVVKVSVENLQTVSTVTMTGETNAVAGVQLNDTNNAQRLEGWYFKNTNGGQTTVTATFSASAAFRAIGITEWSGVDTAAPLDKTASGLKVGTNAAEITSPDVTPVSDGQLIWGAVDADAAAATANAPFTLLESEAVIFTGSEDQIQGTAAAVHASFANTGAVNWGAILMTFKAAAAGPAAKAAPFVVVQQAINRGATR